MNILLPSTANLISALLCLTLGIIVFTRNHRQVIHQAFALLSVNFVLWALGVFAVIQSTDLVYARFWLIFTEVVACFVPATCYHFVGYFPRGQFEGSRRFLASLYLAGAALALVTPTGLYVASIELVDGGPPRVGHGPAFAAFAVMTLCTAFSIFHNLRRKIRDSEGHGRRQAQFVLYGMYLLAGLGVLTNLLAELTGLLLFQAYGPVSTALLMGTFAYAMIRYHLLDIRLILSRLVVFAAGTGFVVATFIGVMLLVRWSVGEDPRTVDIVPPILAALFIALAYGSIKDRVQSFVEGSLLRGRYDINRLYARIAEFASEQVNLDKLLPGVALDIQETIGVKTIRVLLVDPSDRGRLITKFTTDAGHDEGDFNRHAFLIDFLERNPGPLILELLLHAPRTPELDKLIAHLAELDAYFCLPLRSSAGLVGIVTLGAKDNRDPYTADEVTAFQALAGPLGTAIANARLYGELQSLNLHLSRVFGQMREGVIAVDTAGQITAINQAAINIIGQVPISGSVDSLPPKIAGMLGDSLREGRPIGDFETVIDGPDGEPVPVIMSSSCLTSHEHATTGAVALLYDLSQVKRLEQNVLRADRLSSIGTLAAGMAHEIKNPLVSIKTFSQLLLDRYGDPDFRATFKEIVPHEVDRIDTIVSRLLDFARPRPVEFAAYSLRGIVDEVLALVANQMQKSNIEATLAFPDSDILVHGDEQQLHQAFLNLVLNALDSMGERGGRLTIAANLAHERLPRNRKDGLLGGECLKVSITDTGCGISKKNIHDLFTPFFTTKPSGCGLGLAVVHGIVTEHGGEIDVSSVEGRGTTFTLALPLAGNLHAQPVH